MADGVTWLEVRMIMIIWWLNYNILKLRDYHEFDS